METITIEIDVVDLGHTFDLFFFFKSNNKQENFGVYVLTLLFVKVGTLIW